MSFKSCHSEEKSPRQHYLIIIVKNEWMNESQRGNTLYIYHIYRMYGVCCVYTVLSGTWYFWRIKRYIIYAFIYGYGKLKGYNRILGYIPAGISQRTSRVFETNLRQLSPRNVFSVTPPFTTLIECVPFVVHSCNASHCCTSHVQQ